MGDVTMVTQKKERLDARGRVLRRGLIFARLREGYPYDEIAREEQLTPDRVHEIVREALAGQFVEDETDHAKLQLARLSQATRDGDRGAGPEPGFGASGRAGENGLGGRRKPLKRLDPAKET
jgi:hypothetical protein